jgi:hypothetical protein
MRLSVFIFIMIILAGCANQVTPTGGAKDKTPPVVVDYEPDSASTFFDTKEIVLTFDEYVQLNDVFNQVVISPPLNNVPEFKLKKKTVTITLNDTLKPSTTYTINFGQAIKDITESNALENFTYVFSTGEFIDSLQISGKVSDVLTGAPSPKTYVVLYLDATDTSFTTSKPYYFAKTDEAGNYMIKNIRSGRYKLFAIDDKNFNYYYDLPNEKIAFQSGEITIDSNITNQKLQLFSEDKMPQNLVEIKSSRYGSTRMVFAKNARDVSIKYNGSDSVNTYFTRNISNDTIIFWNKNYKTDSHYLSISYDTTLLNKTVAVKPFPADSNFFNQINTHTSNVISYAKGGAANARADWDPNKKIVVQFYNPLTSTPKNIQVYNDSNLVTDMSITLDSLDSRKLYIQYNWKPERAYDVIIPNKSASDIFGLYNVADTFSLQIRKQDAYASLSTTIKNQSGASLIFQFMKFDLTILEERYLNKSLFENETNQFLVEQQYLLPGVYRLRVIIDTDGNGKFTPGNLSENRQPETVLFFPVDQNLRANWENEIDWEIK